jgi:hypothetical protein
MASINYWLSGTDPPLRKNTGIDISFFETVGAYRLVEEELGSYRIDDLVRLRDGWVIKSYKCSLIVSFYESPENFRNINGHIIYLHTDERSDLEKLARICELPFDKSKVEELWK